MSSFGGRGRGRGRGREFRGRRSRGRGFGRGRGRGRKRGGGSGLNNESWGIDMFGPTETIQDAPPCKKFPNETYPDFFLKFQIPRLKKMKQESASTERDQIAMQMMDDLTKEIRESGYFVHGAKEVNEHYERNERYLYFGSTFPKELETANQRKKRMIQRIDVEFDEDDQRLMVNQEVERLRALNREKGAQDMIVDDAEREEKAKNDIITEMETWDAMKDGESEEEFDIAQFSGDEGVDGEFNEDTLDGADFGDNDFMDE